LKAFEELLERLVGRIIMVKVEDAKAASYQKNVAEFCDSITEVIVAEGEIGDGT
jgi:hypothetical protein